MAARAGRPPPPVLAPLLAPRPPGEDRGEALDRGSEETRRGRHSHGTHDATQLEPARGDGGLVRDDDTPFRAAWSEGFIPVEEYREDGHYVVRADLPGIDPDEDVTVTVDDGYLLIEGERRQEEHDEHHSELRFGSFSRRIPLPKGCTGEDVKATYASGVLTVSLPADGEVRQPTRIPIARSGE